MRRRRPNLKRGHRTCGMRDIMRFKSNPYLCERCHHPVRHRDDQLRVLRIGITIRLHWSCFIRQLRESDTHTAEIIQTGVTSAQPANT